jgi:hypothetical protein
LNQSIPRDTFTQIPQKEEQLMVATSKPSVKKVSYLKKVCNDIIDSKIFVSFMTICTIIALFLNDIQAAFLNRSTDVIMDDILTVLLFVFSIEIVMTVIARKDYPNSFFFWLDIIATASFIQDIDWIIDAFTSLGQT